MWWHRQQVRRWTQTLDEFLDAEAQPMTIRPTIRPRTLLRDTYTVDRFLGRGAFADTYLVRHRYMGMQAMKVLVAADNADDLAAGLGEAFVLSRITHPGIVRVFDANEVELPEGRFPYITMEFVSGGTMAELLSECEGGLRLPVALDLACQIAVALGHAHQMDPPIVHRDIKPANLLLEPATDGAMTVRVVADFGLACRVNRLTEVAEAAGTVMYMSPESLRGYEVPASDVFSAGLVLYELLTGVLPYPARTLRDVGSVAGLRDAVLSMQTERIRPPSYFDRSIPPDVDAVTMHALQPEELRRFESGVEFAAALRACQRAIGCPGSEAGDLVAATACTAVHAALTMAVDVASIGQAVVKLEAAIERWPHLEQYYGLHLECFRKQHARGDNI